MNRFVSMLEGAQPDSQAKQGPMSVLLTLSDRVKMKDKKEADSASAMPQMVRAKENSNSVRGSLNSISFRFLESAKEEGKGSKFRVVLIQEGLGNLKDAFWYSKDALKYAESNGVFEGKKIFADHPSSIEEASRPERSVRDILGHFEGIKYEESKDGRGMLTGEVIVPKDAAFDWARSLLEHAVDYSSKYPDKDFIGLSINANGDADQMSIDSLKDIPESCQAKIEEAKAKGIDRIRVVSKIDDAVSCDMVTEAGASGKVLEIMESNKKKESVNKLCPVVDIKIRESKDIEEGGPGSGRHGGGASKLPKLTSKYAGKSQAEQDAMRAKSRQDRLTKSNTAQVAFQKKSDKIKKGIARAKSYKNAADYQSRTIQLLKKYKNK